MAHLAAVMRQKAPNQRLLEKGLQTADMSRNSSHSKTAK